MPRLNVIIVDDEPLARSRLRRLLGEQNVIVVGEAENGIAALELVAKRSVDVVFLDINMPLMNGLETAAMLTKNSANPPAIIYCTAYDEYAVEAFKSDVSDYLLKPVSEADLSKALAKTQRVSSVQRAAVLQQQDSEMSLAVQRNGALERIDYTKFISFRSLQKHVFAKLVSGDEILIDYTLKAVHEEFEPHVLQVHRGALVMRNQIKKLSRDDHGKASILLTDDSVLPVSRRHLTEVKKCFQ